MSLIVDRRGTRFPAIAGSRLKGVSWIAVLAGVLVGYASFPVLVALVSGMVALFEGDLQLTRTNWAEMGTATGIVLGVLLGVSWLFAGYVSGRMAQRAATGHGLLLVVVALGLALVAGWIAPELSQDAEQRAVQALRGFGVPTSVDQWGQVATVAGLVAVAAMLVGALAGGALAGRWLHRIARRVTRDDESVALRSI